MLTKISRHIKDVLGTFQQEDALLFNNKIIPFSSASFTHLKPAWDAKSIAFVDGGQAEIIVTGNFCLSFIRIFAQVIEGNAKLNHYKNEFYLFTSAKWNGGELSYESTLFPLHEKLIDENTLAISSNDCTIRHGIERAPIAAVSSMARRFAELALASTVKADFILLDGTLDSTLRNEELYLQKLPLTASALAKTSSLFTLSGNHPAVLLNKIGPAGCWQYQVDKKTHFMKLHPQAKHIFRVDGNKEVLPHLLENSADALFLGYPYGLMLADKFARVSNEEKKSLMTNFLLRKENKEIAEYLNAVNAHEILDNLG